MKRILLFAATLLSVVYLSSCTKKAKSCFSSSTVETTKNTSITFTSCSENETSLTWDFGDGTQASGAVVNHQYANNGSYTVTLTATGKSGSSVTQHTITISDEVYPCFSYPDGYVNRPVSFTNCSSNASTYKWSFGDGSSSTDENPQHTYTTAGTFAVTLEAISASGNLKASSTFGIQIEIFNPSILGGTFDCNEVCTPNSNHSYGMTQTVSGNTITFDNFADYGFSVTGTINGATITIPNQSVDFGGGVTGFISGSVTTYGIVGVSFSETISYQGSDSNGNSVSCTIDGRKR